MEDILLVTLGMSLGGALFALYVMISDATKRMAITDDRKKLEKARRELDDEREEFEQEKRLFAVEKNLFEIEKKERNENERIQNKAKGGN